MSKNASSKITRRRFAQVTAVAAAATIAPAGLLGQSEQPPKSAAPAETKPLTPQQQAEAEAQTANIVRKYGSRLNEAERADILRQLREAQKSLADFRAYPLDNADSPATVLRTRPRSSGA
jgi:hypothetical protein